MKTKEWVYDGDYITTVHSTKDETKTYDIRRTKGILTCDCARYRFSRSPKGCHHLDAYREAVALPPIRSSSVLAQEVGPVHVTVSVNGKDEMFVVARRRAISFSDDLT